MKTNKVLISIKGENCNFEGSEKAVKVIKNSIQVFQEGAIFSEKFKRGYWDGFIKFYRNNSFKKGLLDIVLPVLNKNKIEYQISIQPEESDIRIFKLNPSLYEHQKQAVKAFIREKFGIVQVPTRGGKTYISAEIIRQLELSMKKDLVVLFLVDGVDLFKQTVDELSSYLGIDSDDIGKFNDKNFFMSQINVAMIQTLTATKRGKNLERKKLLSKLVLKTNFLIIDECHEYSSKQRQSFINSFKALKFRLALSATPFKDDIIQRFSALQTLGGIIYRITREELVKAGVLSDDKALLICYENKVTNFCDSYQDYLRNYIHENEDRHNLLQTVIDKCQRHKLKTLVLFNSKVFGKEFERRTGHVFISGDDKSHTRNLERMNFLKGNLDVLLASNIFKKGITLPEAQVIILADGGQESSSILQKRGRVLGTTKDKNRAILIDIIDIGVKHLSDHALRRLDLYDLEFGRPKIEVYSESELLDLEESLKEWFDV